MSEDRLNSIQELIERKLLLAEVSGGLTASDEKFIDLWNYTMDLQQENKELKEDVKSARSVYEGLLEEVEKLNDKIKYLKGKIENKDRWCQLIADIGYDYDGFREVDNLMGLIDELVKYALYSRDDYDCLEWEKESDVND